MCNINRNTKNHSITSNIRTIQQDDIKQNNVDSKKNNAFTNFDSDNWEMVFDNVKYVKFNYKKNV